nr:MAG TPA: cytochrome B6-F complex subunit [Caudoviricetes sp.]
MDKDIFLILILILTNLSTLGLFLAVFYQLKREKRIK